MSDTGTAPVSEMDFVTDEVAQDPYPFYAELRQQGPVVWLEQMNYYAVVSDQAVREALDQPLIFSSAKGITQNSFLNEITGGRSTIATDPPQHQIVRSILGRPLRPRKLKEIEPWVREEADALILRLTARDTFDGMRDLAWHLPLSIVSHLVGLPEEGRERILTWATAFIHAAGGENQRAQEATPLMQEMFAWSAQNVTADRVTPDGWAKQIFDADERGEVPEGWAMNLITDYIPPALDTTISATGSLLMFLGEHPEQWDLLKRDPKLMPAALGEALRLDPPLQGFSRYVTEDTSLQGTRIPAGSRVNLMLGSANRDGERWDRPDEFDITRPDATQHLGFGFGEHVCIGQGLAKLEITSLLEAMIRHVDRIEIGVPQRKLVNGARLLERLPMSFS
ncbi:MAG: cytochrome P450 [Leucobacter sp.]